MLADTDDVEEIFQRIGDLPVMICVLAKGGRHYVGFSVSSPQRFDEEISRKLARNRAMNALLRAGLAASA